MTETITADIRKKNPSQDIRLVDAIRTDAGNDQADSVAKYIGATRQDLDPKEVYYGAILHYDRGSGILEVEYSTMSPLEFTLRDTAITFAYHARLEDGVMNLSLDFNQAQPIVNDEDDPIMLVIDLQEHAPVDTFADLYGMYGNNAFANNPDGLHGWDDAGAFESALGKVADLHHLLELMRELRIDPSITAKGLRERLEDLQFYPTLDKYGWPKWSKTAVLTGVNMLINERS